MLFDCMCCFHISGTLLTIFPCTFNRLVLDADTIPVVIPFVHTGMQEIMPIGANFPRIGKTVCYLIYSCPGKCRMFATSSSYFLKSGS